jgi:hypothetical protein
MSCHKGNHRRVVASGRCVELLRLWNSPVVCQASADRSLVSLRTTVLTVRVLVQYCTIYSYSTVRSTRTVHTVYEYLCAGSRVLHRYSVSRGEKNYRTNCTSNSYSTVWSTCTVLYDLLVQYVLYKYVLLQPAQWLHCTRSTVKSLHCTSTYSVHVQNWLYKYKYRQVRTCTELTVQVPVRSQQHYWQRWQHQLLIKLLLHSHLLSSLHTYSTCNTVIQQHRTDCTSTW